MFMPPVTQVLVVALMVTAAIYDIRFRRIPNWLTLPVLPLGFALNGFLYGWRGLALAGIGFGLAALIYLPLYALRGMGGGDLKLAAGLGALAGWLEFFWIFVLTGILGGIIAIVLLVVRGRMRKTFHNTFYIVWELVHLRPPYQSKSEELDIGGSRAYNMPHGAVLALGALLLVGWRAFGPR